jgi:hypothetical protein
MDQSAPQCCEVVGIEIEPLPDLSDLLIELPHLLPICLLPSLLVPNGELLPLHEDLLQLLILHNHLIHLCKSEQAQLQSRHLHILIGRSDLPDQMQGLLKLEHPDTLQQLQVQ